jgi:hypothetical protein
MFACIAVNILAKIRNPIGFLNIPTTPMHAYFALFGGKTAKNACFLIAIACATVLGTSAASAQISGVCVAFCDDYTPPQNNSNNGSSDYYDTPRGQGWFCEARAADGSWGWGESPNKSNARSYALSECGNHASGCSITFCKQGGGKGYSPNRKAKNPSTKKGKLRPSTSQRKKIKQQKQLANWRRKSVQENKKCLAAFDVLYFNDERVATLTKHCSAALDYCQKGRGKCNVDRWNMHLADAVRAKEDKRYADAVSFYDAALDLCGYDDDCTGVGSHTSLEGMRTHIENKRRKVETLANLQHEAGESQGRIVDAATTQQSDLVDAVSSGLSFLEPETFVPSKKANYLLDALQFGDGDWRKSVDDLERIVRANPDDTSARDALIYLKGLYQGHLTVSKLSNARYRQGINSWMEGDYKEAALHLSEAYLVDPSDSSSLEAYGLVSGLAQSEQDLNWQGNCGQASCPPPDPLSYPAEFASLLNERTYKLLDEEQRARLLEARALYDDPNANPDHRAALQYVEGLAAWDDFRARVLDGAAEVADLDGLTKAYIRLGRGDIEGAKDLLSDIAFKDDATTFAYYHALGLAEDHTPRGEVLPWLDFETRLEATWREISQTKRDAETLVAHDPSSRPPWQVIDQRLRAQELAAWAQIMSDPFATAEEIVKAEQ